MSTFISNSTWTLIKSKMHKFQTYGFIHKLFLLDCDQLLEVVTYNFLSFSNRTQKSSSSRPQKWPIHVIFFGKNRALGLVAVALSFHATIRSMSTRTSRHFGGLAHSSSVHFLNFTLGKQWKTPWYIMTCPHALLSVIKHGWSVVTTCGKRAGGNQHIYRHKSRHVGSKTTVFGC